MIEIGNVPIAAGMTARAFGAILPVVCVVFGMTADARCFRLWRRIIVAVASRASGCRMFADQWESGLAMIKACVGPCRRIVTIGTGCTARTVVSVVACMTADTGPSWIADRIIGTVTARACRCRMLAQQWEIGIARMVERCRRPSCGAVARRTIGTARAIMPIITGMA